MSRKLKVKLVVVAVLTALIAGSMLATGSGRPVVSHGSGSVR